MTTYVGYSPLQQKIAEELAKKKTGVLQAPASQLIPGYDTGLYKPVDKPAGIGDLLSQPGQQPQGTYPISQQIEKQIEEAKKAAQTGTTTTAPIGTTLTTPALYTPEYYENIRKQYRDAASQTISSDLFKREAEQQRSKLAGMGILSGSAYDTIQQGKIGDILSQGERAGQEAVQQAMLKGAEYEAGAPERELERLTARAKLLEPLIGKGNTAADQEYNNLMNKIFGLQPNQPGAPAPAPGADKPSSENKINFIPTPSSGEAVAKRRETIAPKLTQMTLDYKQVYPSLKSWINQSHIHQQSPAAKAFDYYNELADKIKTEGADISDAEIAEYNALTTEFKKIIKTGQPSGAKWITNSVFEKYAGPAQQPQIVAAPTRNSMDNKIINHPAFPGFNPTKPIMF